MPIIYHYIRQLLLVRFSINNDVVMMVTTGIVILVRAYYYDRAWLPPTCPLVWTVIFLTTRELQQFFLWSFETTVLQLICVLQSTDIVLQRTETTKAAD